MNLFIFPIGETTRPGFKRIDYETEYDRVQPFLDDVLDHPFNDKAVFSLDTRKASLYKELAPKYDLNIFNTTNIGKVTKEELEYLKES